MVEVMIKFVTFVVMPISGFFVLKNFLKSELKIYAPRNILILLGLALLTSLLYQIEYHSLNIILNFVAIVICYKLIFKLDFSNSFMLSTILMILIAISDTLTYLALNVIFGMEAIRNYGIVMMASNVLVGIFAILLSYIRFVKVVVNKLLTKIESKTKLQILLIAFLWIVVVSCIGYFIVRSYENAPEFYLSVSIEIIFIIFILVYFKEKNQNSILNERFNNLFDYIQTVEDIVESEQLNVHEYKNQLTVIRGMSKNKKINDYIDSIVISPDFAFEPNSDLKKLPKGGLKGLLYYKCAIARKKGLNILISISKNSCNILKNITSNDVKVLSRLLGVYLDNAIEASEVSANKNLSVEIYNSLGQVNIVISNSIVDNLDISKFGKNGFSTKGENRGKGLYLVSKILKSNSKFKVTSCIINEYYVQRIIINN